MCHGYLHVCRERVGVWNDLGEKAGMLWCVAEALWLFFGVRAHFQLGNGLITRRSFVP